MEEEVVKSEIKIFISKCKGLQQSKSGGQFVVSARVEFGNTLLGESAKVEINQETGYFVFDFSCSLNVSIADPLILDEIAQTPIVVTFNEILPKDKKTKEEKTNTFGQCCIDLLSLLRGESGFSLIEPIHALVQDALQEQSLPEVHIDVSIDKPLLTEEQLESCNLMTICVESLFSLPESWNSTGMQYAYAACLSMPVSGERETSVILPSGTFRESREKEVSEQRKRSCARNASGEIVACSYENEDGDLRQKEDFEFRKFAETEKSRVTWNAERRCFMSHSANICFQQKISNYRRWPVEIIRVFKNIATQKVKGKDEELGVSFHGVAYIDLAPLLYPGVSKIHGAFLVQPYNETEMVERFNHKTIITEDMVKTMIGAQQSNSGLGAGKNAGKKTDAKTKQSLASLKTDGDDSVTGGFSESSEYVDAKTYVVLEIELEKPLVRKREMSEVKTRISELIPPRPAFTKKQGGSEKAIKDYQNQIGLSANVLLEEFRKTFSGVKLSETLNDAEERRSAFFYHLNTSGKYCALKEQIKHFVIKIVREKFLYTSNFKSQEEMQSFTTDLYRFLIDHMHQGLNKFLLSEETAEVPPTVFDTKSSKRFAQEAEDTLNFDKAAKYYQERLLRNRNDPDCHIDYGIFCLMIEDFQKGEQCFKDSVSINQEHCNGLLLSGLCALMQEEFENSEHILDSATYIFPDVALPWTLLGLLYVSMENCIMSERSFNKANEIHRNEKIEISIFIEAAKFLLDCNMLQLSERALAHELLQLKDQVNVAYLMLLAELCMKRKEYPKALEHIENALKLQHQNSDAWALKGHVYFLMHNLSEAGLSYERCLVYETLPSDLNRVYTRIALVYLEQKKYKKAKKTHLYLCEHFPSCRTWLGLGITCYELDELDEAEHCLNEANIFDNLNGTVWSYLTLVCVKKKKVSQAEQCFKYSIKLGAPKELREQVDQSIKQIIH